MAVTLNLQPALKMTVEQFARISANQSKLTARINCNWSVNHYATHWRRNGRSQL